MSGTHGSVLVMIILEGQLKWKIYPLIMFLFDHTMHKTTGFIIQLYGLFWLKSSRVGSSFDFSLLLLTFIRGYKDLPGTESCSLVSLTLSTEL